MQTGSVTLASVSDGTGIDGLGTTSIGTEAIAVTGTVYREAVANVAAPAAFITRVGTTEAVSIGVGNAASTDGFSESLLANVLGTSGSLSVSPGTTGDIVAGGTSSLGAMVNIGTAGVVTDGVTLGLYSDGTGIEGLGTTSIGTQTIAVTGTVYREAAASVTTPATFITHVGTAATPSIVIANTAAADGFSENLLANIVAESASITPLATATGDIAAGNTATLGLDIASATAGVISAGVTLDLASDGTGIDGLGTIGIGTETIAVTGTIFNYATAAVAAGGAGTLSGSGNTYTLNLGTVTLGSGLTTATLNLDNIATGVADGLSVASTIAALNGVFVNNGFGNLPTMAAGQASSTMDVSMGSGTAGTFTEVLSFTLSRYGQCRVDQFDADHDRCDRLGRGNVRPGLCPHDRDRYGQWRRHGQQRSASRQRYVDERRSDQRRFGRRQCTGLAGRRHVQSHLAQQYHQHSNDHGAGRPAGGGA